MMPECDGLVFAPLMGEGGKLCNILAQDGSKMSKTLGRQRRRRQFLEPGHGGVRRIHLMVTS